MIVPWLSTCVHYPLYFHFSTFYVDFHAFYTILVNIINNSNNGVGNVTFTLHFILCEEKETKVVVFFIYWTWWDCYQTLLQTVAVPYLLLVTIWQFCDVCLWLASICPNWYFWYLVMSWACEKTVIQLLVPSCIYTCTVQLKSSQILLWKAQGSGCRANHDGKITKCGGHRFLSMISG